MVFFIKEPDTFFNVQVQNILDKIKISLYLLMHYYFSFKSSSVTTLKLLLTVAPPSSSNLPSSNESSLLASKLVNFDFSSSKNDFGSFLND